DAMTHVQVNAPPPPQGSMASKDPAPPTFGSTVQFIIAASFDTGPGWVLKYFKGPSGSKGLLNGGKTNTDTLIIAFSPGKPISSRSLMDTIQRLSDAKEAHNIADRDLAVAKAKLSALTKGPKASKLENDIAQAQARRASLEAQIARLEMQRSELAATQDDQNTLSRANAAAQAQAFTTNIILQNLAGEIH
ncbi:MAG TPA: hypothetical protein VLT91_00620, partial [Rhizomicrobium sp.]|nr:hypothetical protein [Rhizomicrobium sp.]